MDFRTFAQEKGRPVVVAHRGYAPTPDIVRDSLPAFTLAKEVGAEAIEFDVRLTGDGEVVIHHGPYLITRNGVDRIDTQPLDNLYSRIDPIEMPTFKKVYEEVGDLFLFVQIKNPRHTVRIIERISEIVPTNKMDHISFMGYQDSIIQNETYPDLLWGKHYFIPTIRNMKIIKESVKGPEIEIVSPFYLLLTERRLKLVKELKTSIVPYTPNTVKALKKVVKMDVEAFYTDQLEKALKIME